MLDAISPYDSTTDGWDLSFNMGEPDVYENFYDSEIFVYIISPRPNEEVNVE